MKRLILLVQILLTLTTFANLLGIAGGSEGIFVFDSSDPLNPKLVLNINTDGYSYDIDFIGNTIFVADGTNGVSVYRLDKTGGYDFIWNASIPGEDFISIKNANGMIFAGTGNGRLYQFFNDIVKKEIIKLTGPISDIEYEDGLLYICGGSSGVVVLGGLDGHIRIDRHYPIKTPIGIYVNDGLVCAAEANGFVITNGVETGRINLLDVEEIYVKDELAFIANGPFGMKIIDISDTTGPFVISGLTFADAVDIELLNNTAYLSCISYGLITVDISNTKKPEIVSVYDEGSYAIDLKLYKGFLIVSDNRYLKIFKIVPGEKLKLVENYSTPFFIRRIFTTGNNAYAMGLAGKLLELNISDAGTLNPRIIETEGTGNTGIRLGDYIINAEGANGLVIYEIDGDEYIPISKLRFPNWVLDIAIRGTTGYILAGDLYIMDFSVPFEPVILSEFSLNGYPVRLALMDNRAYIASEFYGLIIVDTSIAEAPRLIGENRELSHIRNVAVYGDHIFLSSGADGVDIFSGGASMNFVCNIDTPGLALATVFEEKTMFIADHSNGIVVVDISDIEKPTVKEDLVWAVFHNLALSR